MTGTNTSRLNPDRVDYIKLLIWMKEKHYCPLTSGELISLECNRLDALLGSPILKVTVQNHIDKASAAIDIKIGDNPLDKSLLDERDWLDGLAARWRFQRVLRPSWSESVLIKNGYL